MAGLQVGQAFGICYLGLWSAAPAPGFLGTQLPCATQALNQTKCIRELISLSCYFW